jgi:hypothetical protein
MATLPVASSFQPISDNASESKVHADITPGINLSFLSCWADGAVMVVGSCDSCGKPHPIGQDPPLPGSIEVKRQS